jgi:creatinine amidohydrolase
MKTKKSVTKDNLKIIKMEELSWKQIQDMDRDKTIFFLPISPLEEHGPHLPVGTDFLTSKDTAIAAIRILNNENKDLTNVLLPTIPLGYCKFNMDFPGSISVSSNVIKKVVYSIGSSLAMHGFKYLIICTHHMALAHIKGIHKGMEKVMRKYNIKVCEPWGPYFYNNEIKKREPKLNFDTSKEMHAGFRETSLMKYQYPYLVDESYKKLESIYRDLKSPRILGKMFKEIGLEDGYVGNPSRADADYGRWFFQEIVNVYVKSTLDLFMGKKLKDLPINIKMAMKSLFWQ